MQQRLEQVYSEHSSDNASTLLLHSADGLNWSRESLDAIAGFPTYGPTRIQSTTTNVLITLAKRTDVPTASTVPAATDVTGANTGAGPLPAIVVLVGTPKS